MSLFRQRFRAATADPVWMRFLTWEAAAQGESGKIVAETARRDSIARQGAAVRDAQAKGELPADLSPELLQLAIYALSIYPLAFAQSTEMVTGLSPTDPKFQAEWAQFLDELAKRLANG